MLQKTIIRTILLMIFVGLTMTLSAQGSSESQVQQVDFESATLERTYQYGVYLPAGYDEESTRYPVIYLLHGRGDGMSAWLNVRATLDELIANGDIPPIIAVMPDMPSSGRGNYYVDSAYEGFRYTGEAVETAFFADLIPHVDSTYRTLADRRSRLVGGYSMGGYGAIRYVLAHPDQFRGAIILSPAVYTPLPPEDSSAREFGAFGTGETLFDEAIYTELNYPTLLENYSGEHRLNVFIAVGDDEWKHPNPEDMEHDLDFESHRFFNRVARVPTIGSEFRVYDGGHDWDVWTRGFVEGMRYLSNYLETGGDDDTSGSAAAPDGWLTGTTGDDFAGGIATNPADGSVYQAVAAAGSLHEQAHSGGLDIAVTKYGADRVAQWTVQAGTAGDDRPYGAVVTSQGEVVVVGYTQGDFDGAHADNESDDIVVFKLSADGEVLWRTQLGTPEADRGYAVTVAADDAVIINGYTKGNLAGDNAGDKDIVTAMLSADGEVLWVAQTGGDGEDKGQAVAAAPDGTIYAGGMTSSALTSDAAGGIDGVILQYAPDGTLQQTLQFGTAEWDEATGAVVDGQGNLVVTGFTGEALAGDFSGDKDIYAMMFDPALQVLASDQIGTNLNDKGAALTIAANGDVVVAGYSDGDIAGNMGGFDVIVVRYDADYQRAGVWQLGTPERDGTDEWAEKNLFIAPVGDGVILSGLTLGDIGDSIISGGSDVFTVESAAAEE